MEQLDQVLIVSQEPWNAPLPEGFTYTFVYQGTDESGSCSADGDTLTFSDTLLGKGFLQT
jgi:hypothetical protein